MQQAVRKTTFTIIVFTWLEDNKVFVKYYHESTGKEVDRMDDMVDHIAVDIAVGDFFKSNPELIKWRY